MRLGLVVAALSALLVGCAQTLATPSLDESVYVSRYENSGNAHVVAAIEISNRARQGVLQRDGSTGFSESRSPLEVSEPTWITVEKDLRRYFESTTQASDSSKLKVLVTILKADSFEAARMNGTSAIPIVGIFTGVDTKIGMNLKVRVEIEKSGELVKAWTFARRLERVTSRTESREADYQALVRDYREVLFDELDVHVMREIAKASREG